MKKTNAEQSKKGAGGRPTDYSAELAAAMCADIAFCEDEQRGFKVHEACKKHGIAVSSFFLWLTKHKEFSEAYARAREVRAEQLFEEVIEIPDSLPAGLAWELPDGRRFLKVEEIEDEELQGKAQLKGLSKEVVAKANLQVSSRQWYLSKLLPKQYGSREYVESRNLNGNINAVATEQQLKDAPDELIDALAGVLKGSVTK